MNRVLLLLPLLVFAIGIVPESFGDTFSSDTANNWGYITDINNNNVCDSSSLSQVNNGTFVDTGTFATSNTVDCRRAYFDFDISSIPDTATVTDVTVRFEVSTATNAIVIDWVSLGSTRGTDTAATIWAAIASGDIYVDDDSTATSTGTNLSLVLGADAVTDVQALLASDYFSFGMLHDDEVQDASDHFSRFVTQGGSGTPDFTLEIEYFDVVPLTEDGTYSPTDLTVNDCNHTCTTQLNLEWTAITGFNGTNGYRIFQETPVGGGWGVIWGNTSSTDTYWNVTSLVPGQFYNYKVAAINSTHISGNTTAYVQSPHKLPDVVDDLVMTTNDLLQFLGTWTVPDNLYGTLLFYQVNYTTPEGDPMTIFTSVEPDTDVVIDGLDPTSPYSFRTSAITYHGINATGNIFNSTLTGESTIGDLVLDEKVNPDTTPIWYELFNVDNSTDDVQVRFDSSLTVDCTVTDRLQNTSTNYTSIAETSATGYVYHNFTVTNAGNAILDWDCFDQTDATINGQYSLTQSESASGVGGFANVPLFSQINNFSSGLYGTEGELAGIDLITIIIVMVSMLGFNRYNPAVGVGVMATFLGAAWYFELIPWTSGVFGGIALVLVLAIGQGLKNR